MIGWKCVESVFTPEISQLMGVYGLFFMHHSAMHTARGHKQRMLNEIYRDHYWHIARHPLV